jgi:cobalt-zinc-cadmium efflux system protein
MGHGHPHLHLPGPLGREQAARRLRWAILLNALFILVELSAGLAVGSLALVGDAWHNVTDILALGIAWFALRQVQRPADAGRTFGYHRAGILAALANSILLAGVTLNLGLEAVQRLRQPPAVSPDGGVIVAVAAVGVLVNGAAAFALRGTRADLNLRTAFLHLLGDAMVSGAVVLAGALILAAGWRWPDPVAGLLVAGFIVSGAWRILREALNVLMEGTPRGVDVAEVSRVMAEVPGVRGVHHVHVWSLSADLRALSCHLVVADQPISSAGLLLREVRELLGRRFGIRHVTVELESELPEAGALLRISGCEAPVRR